MKRVNIIIALLVFLVYVANAQKKEISKANKAFKKGNFKEALDNYEKAVKKGANLDDPTKENIANCYNYLGDYGAAKEFYNEIPTDNFSATGALNYALLLQKSGEYAKAIEIFNVAIYKGAKDPVLTNYKESCEWATQNPNKGDYEVLPSGLDLGAQSFGCQFYKEGIVFSGRSPKSAFDFKGSYLTDLYYAEVKGDRPSNPALLAQELALQDHEGAVTFTSDQTTIYFTKTIVSKKGTRQTIATATFDGKVWKNIKEVPFNNSKYNCMHPALSPDGKSLFFSSDMPGGNGGKDLYVISKEGEKWGAPLNLGPKINTVGNEVYPFISHSGELYFSSDGHSGYGGLDVFYAIGDGKEWLNVTNIKTPINSSMDDFGFIWEPEKEKGFVSSNRNRDPNSDQIYVVKAIAASAISEFLDDKNTDKKKDNKTKTTKSDSTGTEQELFEFLDKTGGQTSSAKDTTKSGNVTSDINKTKKPTESGDLTLEEHLKQMMGPNAVTYRVQFLSTKDRLDKLQLKETGDYVYRYFYEGLWRYTVGEYYETEPAIELKNRLRTLGYKDAFVAAFRGDKRALDVPIYKKK